MTNTFQKELYSDFIRKIRCGSYHGRVILAKPILLYSVINLIENNVVFNNRIPFDVATEDEYKNKSQGLYCAYTLYSLEHRKEFSAITSSPTLPVTKRQSNKFTMSSRTTDWTSRL